MVYHMLLYKDIVETETEKHCILYIAIFRHKDHGVGIQEVLYIMVCSH